MTNNPCAITPDVEAMLEASIRMFWRRGYDATSMDDVVNAMDIPPEYLKDVFSSKEELYSAATHWYLQNYGRRVLSGFALHSNCVDAIRVALYECVDVLCEKGAQSDGCLFSTGLLEISNSDPGLTREISDLRHTMIEAIKRKLRNSAAKLRPGTPIETLARFYAATLQGLASQAKDGTSKEELFKVVDMSMIVLRSYLLVDVD